MSSPWPKGLCSAVCIRRHIRRRRVRVGAEVSIARSRENRDIPRRRRGAGPPPPPPPPLTPSLPARLGLATGTPCSKPGCRSGRLPECLLVAMSGCSGHAAGPTALPLKADLQAAMSDSPPISSASPPGVDLPGDAPVGPLVTLCGHSLDYGVQKVCVPKTRVSVQEGR